MHYAIKISAIFHMNSVLCISYNTGKSALPDIYASVIVYYYTITSSC